MITLLDCIERIPTKLETICLEYEKRFQYFDEYIKNKRLEKVIFIASGTSYNSAFTTKCFF